MFGTNIGVDLGTTNVVIYMQDKGVVLDEPCVVAYDFDNKIVGVGKKAYDMLEKSPSDIRVVKPMVHGAVSDFTATKHLLSYFLSKICKNMIFKPNVIICVPSTITGLEKRTILDLATAAGAAKACIIEEPLAACLGASLEDDRPRGVMVIDIGGGTTDVAVITMGCVSISRSVRVAGNAFDEAIMRQLKRERDIIIGEKTAQYIKTRIGSALLRDIELGLTVNGKNYITNMPGNFEVTSTEIFLAIRPCLEIIVKSIIEVLESTTPDLVADILESGIYLTGGGSQLRNIDKMLTKRLGIEVRVAEDPLYCVAKGTGKALENMDILAQNGYVFKARDELGGLDNAEESFD